MMRQAVTRVQIPFSAWSIRCYSLGMTGESQAVGDALTGAVESEAVAQAARVSDEAQIVCRNCGATVTGKFCGECAQPDCC